MELRSGLSVVDIFALFCVDLAGSHGNSTTSMPKSYRELDRSWTFSQPARFHVGSFKATTIFRSTQALPSRLEKDNFGCDGPQIRVLYIQDLTPHAFGLSVLETPYQRPEKVIKPCRVALDTVLTILLCLVL
ncbi:hypothetical protein BKA64DRAFT_458618 [Cadophora sp. MPI-SDFR-AT-0126]|nr:hypothetical protein BKA64DRAFT_458618 [Leotiomycetes sp. MPI-SDFR-AT-0126]